MNRKQSSHRRHSSMVVVTLFFLERCSRSRALAFGIRSYHPKTLRKEVTSTLWQLQTPHFHSRHHRHFSATVPTIDEAFSDIEGKSNNKFQVTSPYEPTGDQPQAIEKLLRQVSRGDRYSVLRGITGTGKTNVMAHAIAKLGRPTLVLCHNKTLAVQLTRELRSCLSKNHVQLFVSYYDHYLPESYNEVSDKYTAKKSSINDELDALRHLATRALVQHSDVVIVASVSCIFGMGMPSSYLEASLQWVVGETTFDSIQDITSAMQATVYTSSHDESDEAGGDLSRGQYQLSENLTGVKLVLWPPSESNPMRVDFTCEEDGSYSISAIGKGHSLGMKSVASATIFPAKHHLSTSDEAFRETLNRIQCESIYRVQELKREAKNLEADRLMQRVSQDLQLLQETKTCPGVENYSRHMALREAGAPPETLLDYFRTDDWLLMVDESHVTLPQLKAMYAADRSRKEKLVKYGFRLPSALDNRPLRIEEFWERVPQAVFVSATPSEQELGLIKGVNEPIDMIIRPTYVCDPEIHVRPIKNQLDNLLHEVKDRASRDERSLAVALTKRDAEDLSDYLVEHNVSATYIHSGLSTHDRANALNALQSGQIDCLVGVNLLREGLDLPQVSLVAVLNADSEGFLRSETALLQMIGRAARNVNGTAFLFANRITGSMQRCIDATQYRRQLQLDYNAEHGKEMKSTKGSSVLSFFSLMKNEIDAELVTDVVNRSKESTNHGIEAVKSTRSSNAKEEVVTDHIPSKPGIYLWKDASGKVLYIGKAKRLRSRVKSYLSSNAKHSTRIEVMLKKASRVDFILTPTDRHALLLESNMIKHHQPAYNVLLKDDAAYPYICASIGDAYPQLTIAPRRQEGERAGNYKYFGPYPKYAEITSILEAIEERYDLRSKCFQARYGEISKAEYQQLFQTVLSEVFESKGRAADSPLRMLRSQYEEASNLFESEYNQCRDIVAVGCIANDNSNYVLHVLQLRQGIIAGQFSYAFKLESGLHTEEDFGDAIQTLLDQQHYPSGEASTPGHFSFFPDEILTQFPLMDVKTLKETIRLARNEVEPERKRTKIAIRTAATGGPRREADKRALQCAIENAKQIAEEYGLTKVPEVARNSVHRRNGEKEESKAKDDVLAHIPSFSKGSDDRKSGLELANLLSLEKPPERIECYDVSHTQGEGTVASRVVFLNGRPARNLYRRFNVQTVDGVDDYASLQEVLERRFRRVWRHRDQGLVDKSDPWAMPDLVVIDGGKGQLSSSLEGMAKANVYPTGIYRQDPKSTDARQVFVQEDQFPTRPSPIGRHAFVPIISLAKNKEEVFSVGSPHPVNVIQDSAVHLLLRSIRDESHRFALYSHRRRRSRANGLGGSSIHKSP